MQISELASAYELCVYCPKMCRFACPVSEATGRETWTPWAKMSTGFFQLEGRLPLEEIVPAAYACTACGACTRYCDWDNDVASALLAIRAEAFEVEAAEPPLAGLPATFEDSAMRKDTRGLIRILDRAVPGELLEEDHRTVYIPGNDALALGEQPLKEAVRVLEHVGSRVGVHPHPVDCGLDLYWAGAIDDFVEAAEIFAEAFEEHSTLIVGSASWVWALQDLYPEYGVELSPQVMHTSEWLLRLLEERVLDRTRTVEGPVFYHDPCFLARYLEVTEAPRLVLEHFVEGEIREFHAHGEDTVCCGGEALVPTTMPAAARAMAADRLREPREAGVETIVSADPRCVRSLKDAGADALDLMTLVGRCL